ncbi:MAG: hypothetical protein J5935_01785 [Lachnospiraceae bacterium]|nr:hypothetical protein [Lachnospiraceae bacterium]
MDKYEFKLSLEEIDKLIDEQAYEEAAQIADEIDWEHVKSEVTLCRISDLYKINGRYEDSIDLLHLARRRDPANTQILYNLCELELKTGNYVGALNYYNEYVKNAPEGPGRYVLQYKLYKAQNVRKPELIQVLENLKKAGYSERWGYELALLYDEAGNKRAAVKECDSLIRYFGSGRFVEKAKELRSSIIEGNEGLDVEAPVSAKEEPSFDTADLREAVAEGIRNMDETEKKESAYESMLSQETNGQIAIALPEDIQVESQITGQINLESIMAEWERVRAAHEQERLKQIKQRVLEDTGPMMRQFERDAKQGVLEDLEREIALEEQRKRLDIPDNLGMDDDYFEEDDDTLVMDSEGTKIWKSVDVRKEEEEKQIRANEEEMAQEEAYDEPYDDEAYDEEAYEDEYAEEPYEDAEPAEEAYAEEDSTEDDSAEEAEGPVEEAPAEEEAPEEAPTEEASTESDSVEDDGYYEEEEYIDEEPMPEGEVEYVDEDYTGDIEVPEDATAPAEVAAAAAGAAVGAAAAGGAAAAASGASSFDAMKAALEKAVQEEAEEAAEEAAKEPSKAEPSKEEPSAEEPSVKEKPAPAPEEKPAADEAEGEEEAEEEEPEGTTAARRLTDEEKELFRPFIHSKKTRRQLSHALDVISLAPYTGNVVITSVQNEDALNLAKALIKEVRIMDQNFSGKVAKSTAEVINRKDLSKALDQIENGALIIEKATELNDKSVQTLHKELEKENRGLIVILIDKQKSTDRFMRDHEILQSHFNARVDLVELSNEELARVAETYAREQGYTIDQYAMLALHTRISQLQTIDHAVSVDEIKAIVDEAIGYASRKHPGHLVDALLKKRYDDNDLIILHEKDFLHN